MTRRPLDPSTGDSSGVLSFYVAVLVLIPAHLIFEPLGAAGTPASMIGMTFVLWWIAARMISSDLPATFQPTRFGVSLFAATIVVSYVSAAVHPLPPDQLSGADRGLLAVVSWVGVTMVASDLIRSQTTLERLLRHVVDAGAFLAVLGLLQFFTGFDISSIVQIPGLHSNYALEFIGERSDFRRVAGTASHPIEFGVVLALVFPLALHFALAEQVRKARAWAIVLCLGIAIPMSLSRSAILGLLAGGLTLFATWSGTRRAIALIVAPVFAVAMRLVVPGLLGTIKSLFVNLTKDDSFKGRTEDYDVVGQFISRSPWIGRGFGTFIPKDFFFLDNQYLGQLVETGYIGLAALILMFVIGVFTARGARRRADDPIVADLAQALAASTVVAAVGFLTFDGLGFPMIDGLVFLLLGCIGAQWRLVGGPRTYVRRRGHLLEHDAPAAV